jgi:hypothetical protein
LPSGRSNALDRKAAGLPVHKTASEDVGLAEPTRGEATGLDPGAAAALKSANFTLIQMGIEGNQLVIRPVSGEGKVSDKRWE